MGNKPKLLISGPHELAHNLTAEQGKAFVTWFLMVSVSSIWCFASCDGDVKANISGAGGLPPDAPPLNVGLQAPPKWPQELPSPHPTEEPRSKSHYSCNMTRGQPWLSQGTLDDIVIFGIRICTLDVLVILFDIIWHHQSMN